MEEASAKVVVVDASVLINLIHGDWVPLLGALRRFAFVVRERAVEEAADPGQTALLPEGLDQGLLRRESTTEPTELTAYAKLRKVIGKGDVACSEHFSRGASGMHFTGPECMSLTYDRMV